MTRVLSAALLVAGALAVPVALASTSDYTASAPVVASPPTSPLPDPCPFQAENPPDQVNAQNTAVEPQIAVNPTNAQNVIGVFQEDRWSDGGAHGLLSAVSSNGGSSYVNTWAEFSACSDKPGGYFEQLPRATDPWVSFDAAGRAYQIGLSIIDEQLSDSAVTASYSTNGGLTWSDPVDLTRDADPTGVVFNDKDSITGDPNVAGRAYATWIRGELPGEEMSFAKLAHAGSYRGLPMFSMTTDGGLTWSTPTPTTNANLYAQGNQIAVLPDGTLLDVQAVLLKGSGIQSNKNAVYMAVQRSTNGGKNWSPPIKIAPLSLTAETADGQELRVGDYIPDIAVDRGTGAAYITWADSLGSSTNKIVLSRSTDGGKSWSAPVVVSHHADAQSFNHAVAVGNDGEVAVLYYDIARNTSAAGIPTDVYLRHSGDGGLTWSSPQLLASFDFANAPNSRGLFLGDYVGLEAQGPKGLIAFFTVTGTTPASADVLSIKLSR
jgi:Neuraminidase (sialidase)